MGQEVENVEVVEVVEKPRNPIWWGVGFTCIPAMVLALGYLNVHPEMYRGIPSSFSDENSAVFGGIDWDEEVEQDPPLRYYSDSFKGLRVTTERAEVSSFWDLFNTPASTVEYEWSYKVENLTDDKLRISVLYELLNRHGGTVDEDEGIEFAEPGETVTIEGTAKLDYIDAKTVRGSTWRIGHRKAN